MDVEVVQSILPTEIAALPNNNNYRLIDVRTPLEYSTVRAVNAENHPLSTLNPHTVIRGNESDTVYVICKSGKRGETAVRKFLEAGYLNVVNVAGGTDAWAAAGLPTESFTRKFTLGLEQQTRIAIGSLVALTSLLVLFHSYFLVLPMLMGLGLVYAGVTDSCLMAMIVSRMPWNHSTGPKSLCSVSPHIETGS